MRTGLSHSRCLVAGAYVQSACSNENVSHCPVHKKVLFSAIYRPLCGRDRRPHHVFSNFLKNHFHCCPNFASMAHVLDHSTVFPCLSLKLCGPSILVWWIYVSSKHYIPVTWPKVKLCLVTLFRMLTDLPASLFKLPSLSIAFPIYFWIPMPIL